MQVPLSSNKYHGTHNRLPIKRFGAFIILIISILGTGWAQDLTDSGAQGLARSGSAGSRGAGGTAVFAGDEWNVYCPDDQNAEAPVNRWWMLFDDSLLDSLVEAGLNNNYNVATAVRRIAIARAQLGSARAGYYPTLGVSAGYVKGQQSGLTASRHGEAVGTGYFDGTLNLQWEIDVFGRITSQVKEKKAQVSVSRAERDAVELSLAAEICQTYIQMRVSQAKLALAHEHAERQMKALKIAKARFDTGLASMMDVDQANQVYYSTVASIPTIESDIHTSMNALAVLLGKPAGTLHPLLEKLNRLPSYRHLVRTGVPADLLRRRPDIIEAEKQVDVAAAALGITRKEWLPSLSVQASVGTQAHNAGDLFKSNSLTYSVAPTLSWTIFDGLARKYATAAARQDMENAIDNYNQTVLTAAEEVDNSLATYFSDLKYIDAMQQVVEASSGYDTRAMENYKSGLSPYINVAQAQMSFLENMNSLISARGMALTSLINLYKALGGDFNEQ